MKSRTHLKYKEWPFQHKCEYLSYRPHLRNKNLIYSYIDGFPGYKFGPKYRSWISPHMNEYFAHILAQRYNKLTFQHKHVDRVDKPDLKCTS